MSPSSVNVASNSSHSGLWGAKCETKETELWLRCHSRQTSEVVSPHKRSLRYTHTLRSIYLSILLTSHIPSWMRKTGLLFAFLRCVCASECVGTSLKVVVVVACMCMCRTFPCYLTPARHFSINLPKKNQAEHSWDGARMWIISASLFVCACERHEL